MAVLSSMTKVAKHIAVMEMTSAVVRLALVVSLAGSGRWMVSILMTG
jgi:hypothetical protein